MSGARTAELRQPKQERSRRTFERILEATLALLRERGPDAFTLAEVCARADASMGAIYGRVSSKDELIRLLHAQELERIDAATSAALDPAGNAAADLDGAVRHLVVTFGSVLRDNADVLRPFMLRAGTDPVISERGRTSHQLMKDLYTATLLQYGQDIGHRDVGRAVAWSFSVVYSVLARRLGLGSTVEGADENLTWESTLAELVATVVGYLRLAG